jgi:hypothetical protein
MKMHNLSFFKLLATNLHTVVVKNLLDYSVMTNLSQALNICNQNGKK